MFNPLTLVHGLQCVDLSLCRPKPRSQETAVSGSERWCSASQNDTRSNITLNPQSLHSPKWFGDQDEFIGVDFGERGFPLNLFLVKTLIYLQIGSVVVSKFSRLKI